jgi:MYXO-CTERM domain-containing protein
MDALLASVLDHYNVDLDRVFIWGLSGGAEFTSTYAFNRQDVFAAVEMNMGGAGRGYDETLAVQCRAPARFVVSTTDFLRDGALGFFEELTAAGHETQWVDADCEDHCWDDVEAGPVARDWLLSYTLCGATPTSGCRGDTPDPTTGSGGSTTGADASGTVSTTGALTDTGGTLTGTAGGVGGSAMATSGAGDTNHGSATDGGTATSTTSGVDGTTGGGSDPGVEEDTSKSAYPDDAGGGCACGVVGSGRTNTAWLPLLGFIAALLRRPRR